MRISGGYSLHQSLTTETASIVKQAVSLARRRGHAQVTPLHVAIAMLSCPTSGLFKRACLQAHSHPLQSKALDLCFNVALNRLPTSSSPLLGPHSHLPSLSNALVAAFKRAQAHQRRGSIEHGQQPVSALKVETLQLVISILYDPSVSRVMREAGFSSAQVRNIVEQSGKCDVSINSNNTVLSRNMPPVTSLSHFRLFPSLRKKLNQSEEHTNLALSLSLENSDMHAEADDDCKWLLFDEKGAEIKKQLSCCCYTDSSDKLKKAEADHVMASASTSKLPPWLQQYKDANTKLTNVYNDLQQVSTKPDLVSNPNSSPNSASSSEDNISYLPKCNQFEELDSDYNPNILSDALEKKDDGEEEGDSDVKKCGLLDLNMATEDGYDDDDDGNSVSKEIGIFGFGSSRNSIQNLDITNVN